MSAAPPSESETVTHLRHRIVELEARVAQLPPSKAWSVRPSLRPIAPIVSDAAEISRFGTRDLISARRTAAIARVRFAIYWAARETTGQALAAIGRELGNRDHSTIIMGLKQAAAWRIQDPAFRALSDVLVTRALTRQIEEITSCQH